MGTRAGLVVRLERSMDMTGAADSLGDETRVDGESASPAGEVAQPDQIARFVVLEKLGSGGMGVVYAAWDPHLDRRVALKLVRPDRGTSDAHSRLQREAQAMAKLSHPNVVSVFDVGSHGGSVWIAMEYVDGLTLRHWLNREARGWEQILAMFREAGQGLAAAHAAGLVHRDFKPDNVLIGSDGRARVADFGLVRPLAGDTEEGELDLKTGPESEIPIDPDLTVGGTTMASAGAEHAPAAQQITPQFDLLSAPLTRVGAMVGTPRYMAPEQFQRLVADARSDQFSFCVALYEALYAYPPFAGARFFELATSVTLGSPRTPPRDSPVPAAIGRVLMRGLSRLPGDRFEDMASLIDALHVELRPRRWPWAVASLAIAALAALGATWLAGGDEPAPDPCVKGQAQLARSWGPERRAELERRFTSLELSYADSSLAAVSEGFDEWSQAWTQAYAHTCSTRHEQSAELYDLRMSCLAQRREQAGALAELLLTADEALVRDGPQLVTALPSLDACADVEGLRAVEPPSADQAEAVGAEREALARLDARIDARRVAEVVDELEALRVRAEAIGYAPLLAEVECAEGLLDQVLDDKEGARAHLLHAHELALALSHDRLALDTANLLILVDNFGHDARGVELARRWLAVSSGLSRRLDTPPDAEIDRLWAFGRALTRSARYPEAREQLRAAVRLAEDTRGAEDLRTAEVRLGLAVALGDDGRYAEASAELDRVIAVYERRLSADHPLLLAPLRARVALASSAGELEQAQAYAERRLAIAEAAFGDEHSHTLEALESLAVLHDLQGDHGGARAQFEAILERIGEAQELRSTLGITSANSLCFTLYKLGELEQARAVCERTVAAAEQNMGSESVYVAIALNNLALIARAQGDPHGGLVHDRRALAICEAALGPDHPFTAYSLVGVAEGELRLGHAGAAVAPLERALAIRARAGEPGELGEVQCLLARALGPGERARALELARSASSALQEAGPNWAAHADSCDAWLASASE